MKCVPVRPWHLAFGLILPLHLFMTGCTFAGSPALPSSPGGPIVSPYVKVVIQDIQTRLLPTEPVQVELRIRGTLPDQCKYTLYTLENRSGSNIKLDLSGMHPPDVMCAQSLQDIEYSYLLGRDLPEAQRGFPAGTYQLSVNDRVTTFTIP